MLDFLSVTFSLNYCNYYKGSVNYTFMDQCVQKQGSYRSSSWHYVYLVFSKSLRVRCIEYLNT